MRALPIAIMLFLSPGCSSKFSSDSSEEQPQTDSVIIKDSIRKESYKRDSLNLLRATYVQAINDFIQSVTSKDNIKFDTLFVADRKSGLPDDFPDIELPEIISNTPVKLLNYAQAHANYKDRFKSESPLINIMGWVEPDSAEFILVVFHPEFKHRYDYYIQYSGSAADSLSILSSRTEVLMYDSNDNPDHYDIYVDKKLKGTKNAK